MSFRVALPNTAFEVKYSKTTAPKKEISYLEWIRELPCLVTGAHPVEAAHVSYPDLRFGKLGRGKGRKESDRWAIPLCPAEHRRQHSMDERAYWQSVGIDPLQVALALYGCDGDNTMAEIIIRNASRSAT